MNTYDYFHEVESVTLKAASHLECKLLYDLMKSLSFCIDDDFFYLDRESKASAWQSITVMSVDVYLDDNKLDPSEDSCWNKLEISYLLASLPKSYISVFCGYLSKMAQFLNLKIFYKNEETNPSTIEKTFLKFAGELTESYGEPGSETLAIFIQDTYPR